MKQPLVAPPPLEKMAARKEKLEAERSVLFEVWKSVLEAAGELTSVL